MAEDIKVLKIKTSELEEVLDGFRSQILANVDAKRNRRYNIPSLIEMDGKYFGIGSVTDFVKRWTKWDKGGRKGNEPNLHKRASKGELTRDVTKYNTRNYRSTRLKGPGLRQARALDPLYNEAGELIRESRWPEGKSVKGFYSEMAKHWREADLPVRALEELLGIKVNRGHGVSAMGTDPTSIYPWGGSNWFDNVAPEAAIPNIRHGKKNTNPAGLLYELGQEGGSVDQAFQAYLAGDDVSFNQWAKYSPKELTAILHSPNPEATIAKLDRDALFKAVNPEATGMPDYRAKPKVNPDIPLEIRNPKGKTKWANVQELVKPVTQAIDAVPAPLRKLGVMAPFPVVGSLLNQGQVRASEQRVAENPNLLNKIQLNLDRTALKGSQLSTAGLAGVVTPEPVSSVIGAGMVAAGEATDLVAGGASSLIDVGRAAANPAKISTKNRKLFRHGGNKKEKAHVIKQRQLMLEMLAQERKNKEFETGGR